MSRNRWEEDSLGRVEVPLDRYWGAQTQRALHNFAIGGSAPEELIRALAMIKQAAARANHTLGVLARDKAELIDRVASEAIRGELADHFPLSVYVSGSGTQLNMNVNEVIANRGAELAGKPLGGKDPLHPNDHVNRSQSTNDVFPCAMHLAALLAANHSLTPQLDALIHALREKALAWREVIKLGRTHTMDAVPLRLGDEFGAFAEQLQSEKQRIKAALGELGAIPLGGTAVGTGLNTPPGFAEKAVAALSVISGFELSPAPDKFALMAGHNGLLALSASLRGLAACLFKMASDIRLLGSGPRAGLSELKLPATEPGSSIMPGKVNPGQCEAMRMAACRAMGLDQATLHGAMSGELQMNAMKPLIIANLLEMTTLLGEAMASFTANCLVGIEPDLPGIKANLSRSLMLVTALAPELGYDRAAEIAHYAHRQGLTLLDAALELTDLSRDCLEELLNPKAMLP